jgi:hypothetical protein
MWTCVRSMMASALAILTVASCGSARAQVSKDEILALIRNDPDLHAAVLAQEAARAQEARTKHKKNAANGAVLPTFVTKAGTQPGASPAGNGATSSNTTTVSFLLRNDWSDLGVLGACLGGGVSVDKAKGASLSFTKDYVANNKIWAAQAMAAAVFSDCDRSLHPLPGGGDSGFFEKSVAVYAQVNSNYNSNSTLVSKNSDTRTAGLSGELAYLHSGDYEVVRLTPNVVQDAIKGTTAVAVMGQYLPLWVSRPGIWHTTYIFDGNVSYQFDPTLDLQYASTTDRKKPLQFSGKDQSFRIGPELTLIVMPFAGGGDLLSRIGLHETFHPWYEAYSSNTSTQYWWANAITYNLTADGNFAVGFSYNRGRDENSGTLTNQYIISLNGKM